MNVLAKNIQYLLDKNKMNATQLQERTQITQSTTFRILNGKTETPSSSTLKKYAEYFNVKESDLRYKDLSYEDQSLKNSDNFIMLPNTNIRYVPLFNFAQICDFQSNRNKVIADAFRPIFGDGYGEHVYWVALETHAMNPEFKSGDLVLIDPDLHPNPGDYVIALKTDTNEVVFNKWREGGFDEAVSKEYSKLVPSNKDYAVVDSRFVDFTICGVAIERQHILRAF